MVATMEGVVLVPTSAGIAMPAQGRSAALEDRLKCPSLVHTDRAAMALPIGRCKAFDHLRYRRCRGRCARPTTRLPAVQHLTLQNRSDQIVDVANRLDVADRRQVRIDGRRFDMCVAEIGLNLVQRHALGG